MVFSCERIKDLNDEVPSELIELIVNRTECRRQFSIDIFGDDTPENIKRTKLIFTAMGFGLRTANFGDYSSLKTIVPDLELRKKICRHEYVRVLRAVNVYLRQKLKLSKKGLILKFFAWETSAMIKVQNALKDLDIACWVHDAIFIRNAPANTQARINQILKSISPYLVAETSERQLSTTAVETRFNLKSNQPRPLRSSQEGQRTRGSGKSMSEESDHHSALPLM